MTIPWLPFFLAAIWKNAKVLVVFVRSAERDKQRVAGGPDNSLRLFSFAWLIFPIVFFSFSGSKLPGYILPAVPAAVLITADYVYRFTRKTYAREAALKSLALTTYIVILFALIFVVPGFAKKESVKELIETANARRYSSLPVASFMTVSHNAEFYAAGRIVRDELGKQRKFIGTHELLEYLQYVGGSMIVLVPREHVNALASSD